MRRIWALIVLLSFLVLTSTAHADVRTGSVSDPRDALADVNGTRNPDLEQVRVSYDREAGSIIFVFRLYEALPFDWQRGITGAVSFELAVGSSIGPGQSCAVDAQDGDLSFDGHYGNAVGEWFSYLTVNGRTGGFKGDGYGNPDEINFDIGADGREFRFTVPSKPALANRDYRCVAAISITSPGQDEAREFFFQNYAPPPSPPDGTPPSVSFVSPVHGQTVSGLLDEPGTPATSPCRVNATDNQRVDRVEFLVDGRPLNTEVNAPYTCLWETRTTPDGTHTLTAVAYDRAGLSSTTSVQVNVRNGAASVAGPGAATGVTGSIGAILGASQGSPLRRLRLRRQSLGSVLRRGLAVPVRCAGPCTISTRLVFDRVGWPGRLRRGDLVGRVSRRLTRGGRATIRVRLRRGARKQLKNALTARLRLRTTIVDAAGVQRSVTQRVTLQR